MSYTALYRKFRPLCFEDVKGQEHIVTTLKNQIQLNRMAHAYLFCGTRGTGKTTIAKIFAKAVNCLNPADGSPCGECSSCKAIAEGRSMNVIEIDAASNNGVENVRNIIDEVEYSPVDGKYKVYIIDEVHMLSKGAFNALLKTLEEPPSYVIFILATTEIQSIPITVLSRCQRYDFRRISIDVITARMKELTDVEKMQVEDRALRYIAKSADGSMRDALSLLDQCLAFNYGKELTYDMALNVLGAVDTSVFSGLLRIIIEDNVIAAIELLEKIILQGREIGQFVTDFTWYLRNLMLLMSSDSDKIEDVLNMSTEHIKRLREEADMLDIQQVFRYISVFSELSNKLKYSSQKRILVEMALIKLCRPQMGIEKEDLYDRIRKLEDKIEKGDFTIQSNNSKSEATYVEVPEVAKIVVDALPEDIKKVAGNWGAIRSHLTEPLLSILKESYLSVSDDNTVIYIYINDLIKTNMVKKPDRLEELDNAFLNYLGKRVKFEVRSYDKAINPSEQFADLIEALGAVVEE